MLRAVIHHDMQLGVLLAVLLDQAGETRRTAREICRQSREICGEVRERRSENRRVLEESRALCTRLRLERAVLVKS